MSTRSNWTVRSRELGGNGAFAWQSYGLQVGILAGSGNPVSVVAGFDNFSVKVNPKPPLIAEFFWCMGPSFTVFNQYVNIGGLLPDGLITSKIMPKVTGGTREDMSMYPVVGSDMNSGPVADSPAFVYIRVTEPGEYASRTPDLKARYRSEMGLPPSGSQDDDFEDEQNSFDYWLAHEIEIDIMDDLDVETLMRLFTEQYAIEVPMREVMAKIAYDKCVEKGNAMDQFWPYVEGTSYEDKFVRLMIGANLLDSKVFQSIDKILGL